VVVFGGFPKRSANGAGACGTVGRVAGVDNGGGRELPEPLAALARGAGVVKRGCAELERMTVATAVPTVRAKTPTIDATTGGRQRRAVSSATDRFRRRSRSASAQFHGGLARGIPGISPRVFWKD
jgi:hypothetical protein